MARKKRVPIPPDTDALVRYAADRTCCVCRVPERSLQIHHMDKDPANNSVANLAALCLECHHLTQIIRIPDRQLYLLVTPKPYELGARAIGCKCNSDRIEFTPSSADYGHRCLLLAHEILHELGMSCSIY